MKILAIAPYAGLGELIGETAKTRGDVEVHTHVANMQEGVEIARSLQHNGYDAIISRAGTAELIERIASIPVIGVPISVLDMLRAIRLAQNYAGRFAVVGFPGITGCAETLCDLLQYHVDTLAIDEATDLSAVMAALKEEGYGAVVGDLIAITAAKQLGLGGILVISGQDSVDDALNQAVKWHTAIENAQGRFKMYRHLADSSPLPTFVYDSGGELRYTNFQSGGQALAGLLTGLPTLLDLARARGEMKLIKKLGDTFWGIRSLPVPLDKGEGVAFTCSACAEPGAEEEGAILYHNPGDEPPARFASPTTDSPLFLRILDNMKRFSAGTLPIIIKGERGVGKDAAAYAVHMESPCKHAVLMEIDCKRMTGKNWRNLLMSQDSPLSLAGCTVYFKNLHLTEEAQRLLLERYLEQTSLHRRNRLIFSYIPGYSAEFDQCGTLRYLSEETGALELALPSLSERPEDIPSLAALRLGECNARLGTQVIGFQPGALAALQGFRWSGNLVQLRQVIQELVLLTDSAYIGEEDTLSVLERQRTGGPTSGPALDLSQSLDGIIRDVIRIVLEQEDMNQTKAAARLGIGRSTMWRKLK